jgi:hypothetical protein
MKLDPYLSLCTKIYSKWIKDCKVRLETLKIPQETIGKTLEDTASINFLNRTTTAQQIRARIDKWDSAQQRKQSPGWWSGSSGRAPA